MLGLVKLSMPMPWADDIAVMIHHDSPAAIVEALELTIATYVDQLATHALELNFGAGKTEALLLLRGKNSRKVSRDIFRQSEPALVVQTQAHGDVQVRLVDRYKHLGVQIHANGKILPELRVRVGAAHSAFNAYGKTIYYNRGLDLPRRVQLFNSCVASVLFWNSGTWPPLSDAEQRHLTGAYKRLVRRLLILDFALEELLLWSDARLFAYVGVLPADLELRLQRLRYYGRLIKEGPPALWALLAGEKKWLSQLPEDMAWLFRNIQSAKVRPDPSKPEGQHYWDDLIKNHAHAWKGLLKKAHKHAMLQLCIASEVDVFHQDFMTELENYHGSLTPEIPMATETALHVCLPCRLSFTTKAGWATRSFRKHQRRAPARYLADTVTCDHCFHSFLNPHRLYLHLRYSQDCFQALRGRGHYVAPLPGRGSRQWNQSQQFSQCPYLRAEGSQYGVRPERLPALSPHETDLLIALTELETMEIDWNLDNLVDQLVWPRLQETVCAHPVSLEEIAATLDVWRALIMEDIQPFRRLVPGIPALFLSAISSAQASEF